MAATIVCGIDGGKNGGIAVIHGEAILSLAPMPETTATLVQYIKGRVWPYRAAGIVAVVEELSVNPQFSRTGIMTSARNLGIMEGILHAMDIPVMLVRPQAWQQIMYNDPRVEKLEGKARSIAAATILNPSINLIKNSKCRTPHDGMADAYLIARYADAILNAKDVDHE